MSVTFMVGKKEGNVWGWVENCPELNVSNHNARKILLAGGITDCDELVGVLSPQQARTIADNLEDSLSLTEQGFTETGSRRCKVIHMGTTLDQLRNYAYWLRQIADSAEQEETYLITYA